MNAAKKQEDAYASWAEQQKQNRAAENVRQEESRKQATAAQEKGVADISAEAQIKTQADEEARLAALYNEQGTAAKDGAAAVAPVAAADTALSGQQSGGEVFQADLARSLSDAAASAKQRIGALAGINASGGSYGGLQTVNPIKQQAAGSGIDLANEKRRGSLAAYEVEQAVDPEQISYSNPIADVASSFLGVGANLAGAKLAGGSGGFDISSIFKGKVKPKIGLPQTAPVPATRPWF
jgi:hypothetical protein